MEPDMIDKEFLRLWFAERCDPYKDETLPEAPADLVAELSSRYVKLYEMITGETFEVPPVGVDVNKRMRDALKVVI
jgi:phosphoribosylaminoimidazole-succinocarboxamide synthase